MQQGILIAAVLGGLMSVAVATAEPLTLGQDDTVGKVLTAQKGKKVTIRLGSGEDLSGTVKEVNGSLVQLSELSGKEFYDAVIALQSITAVIVRVKTP
jgi:F0F1-type ATP synthase delta subunit